MAEQSSHTDKINSLLSDKFERFGLSRLDNPISLGIYKEWLASGMNGDMDYLARHLEYKENPELLLKGVRSAISIAQSYLPHPRPLDIIPGLKVALYAQGEDYHHWFKSSLQQAADRLKEIFPEEEFLCSTDSVPVLERDLAYRAGLGWVGKNTCLINEKTGSLFFVGQILTTLNLEVTVDPAADRCGTCTRCIDACPTGAIVEPRKLDARKCISYLTIETKSFAAGPLQDQTGSHYFGCDICQTVCPWNQKVLKAELRPKEIPREQTLEDLRKILTLSGSQIEKMFKGTPLARGSARRHRANAMLVAANGGYAEVIPEIEKVQQSDPKLFALSSWALKKLCSASDNDPKSDQTIQTSLPIT